jgi:hypothetical protein
MKLDEWNMGQIRALETYYLGEAFSGTKKDSFPKLFSGHTAVSSITEALEYEEKTSVVIEAEVIDMFCFKVKKQDSKIYGQECCKILLEDLSGDQIGAIFFPEALKKFRELYDDILPNRKFEKGFGIRLSGKVNKYGNETSIVASDVYGLFSPIDVPTDVEQLKVETTTLRQKKVKEITEKDIEDDLLTIIS